MPAVQRSPYPEGAAVYAELEERSCVEPLTKLEDERTALVEKMADLEALYGRDGLYDDIRKQLLEFCKVEAREAFRASETKATEAMIEQTGYNDPRYKAKLDQAVIDKAEFIRLSNLLALIDHRIKARDTAMYSYNSEVKLAR